MKKEIICTVCPTGCHITVEGKGERIASMEGYDFRRRNCFFFLLIRLPLPLATITNEKSFIFMVFAPCSLHQSFRTEVRDSSAVWSVMRAPSV